MQLASTCASLITSTEACRITDRGEGRARRGTRRVSRTRIGIASLAATDSTRWPIRRLQHRLCRIAERKHEPVRSAHRSQRQHPAARASAWRRRRWRWSKARRIAVTRRLSAGHAAGSANVLWLQFAAQQGFGGANLQSNVVPAPSPGEQFRFYWNTPMVVVAAQSADCLCRRRPVLQFARSGRHVDRVSRSDETNRSQQPFHHGCERQRADGFKERRLSGLWLCRVDR